jgi:L-ascorbate metabolism protein UlaG (beta-lactamase superfamily)
VADDFDDLFPTGGTTRKGLLSAFGRRAAQSVPVPDALGRLSPPPDEDFFDEEPPEHVEPLLEGEDFVAEVHGSREETGMHVWWLGQSGFLVQIGGESILFDPYLSDTLSPERLRITGLVARPELLSFVDVVASTHAHVDALDPGTLPDLLSGDAAFVCAASSEDIAAERGGRSPDAALAPGEAEAFGGFVISAIPAYHEGAPEAVGYVVRNGAYAFYHAGDSRRVQGMAEAVAPHAVDIAFVPIAGVNGVMNGADAARLAYEAGAQVAIPGHYEMFRDDTAGPSRFVAECVRLGLEYRLPRVGERVTIDYGY